MLIVVGLVTAWNLSPAPAAPQSPTEYRREAQEYLAQGSYKKARDAAETAAKLEPQSAEAENLLGIAEFALDELDAAQKHLRRAVELDPGLVAAHRNLGATYLRQKRLTDARREFELALASQPEDFVSLYSLGRTFLLGGRAAEALGPFEKAYKVNPSDATLLAGLLEARLKLKQQVEAARTLGELDRRLDPRDPRRREIAALLALQGSYELAIEEFERLREVEPDSCETNYNLALAYHRAGRQAEAERFLVGLISRRETAELENLLGDVEEERGALPAALQAYRRAAELEPRNEDFRFAYAQALAVHNQIDASLEAFARATDDFPNSERLWLARGAAYYLKGLYEDCARTLLHAAELAPRSPQVYYLLGLAYEASGSSQNQIATQFRTYLAGDPRDAWAYYFYGKILASRGRQGDADELNLAEKHLRKALALETGMAEAHTELASVYEAQGKNDQARRELERAVKLDPKSSTAFYRLSQVYRRLGEKARAEQALREFQALKRAEGEDPGRRRVEEFLERGKR